MQNGKAYTTKNILFLLHRHDDTKHYNLEILRISMLSIYLLEYFLHGTFTKGTLPGFYLCSFAPAFLC